METKRTNKDILVKGIKTMGITAVFMFLGPTLFYVGLSNPDKPLYIPILIAAGIICILAIYFAFKGLKTIMDSMFNK
ncbi:MAG: drug/metabolite transporter (DMT)-like permease [Psychroserpens sp.]|jgi:drug/metabolite transporter (DMT)-like permease